MSKRVMQFFDNYEIHPDDIQRCHGCGAYTLIINGHDYSFSLKALQEHFPKDWRRIVAYARYNHGFCCCNYCVNKWGVDLCGCGSGEKFGECKNGYSECQRPAQKLGEFNQCWTDGYNPLCMYTGGFCD